MRDLALRLNAPATVVFADTRPGIWLAVDRTVRLCLLASVVIACSSPHAALDGGADAPAPDAPPDAATHPLLLAAGGLQVLTTGPDLGLQLTPADLDEDADVLELHQEFYGVPWEAFVAGTAPPRAWVAMMDRIAASARATGRPVFLSISMLNGGRDQLAARTTVDGNGHVGSQDGWASKCYDFATAPDAAAYRQAYLRYASWMTDRFAPRWLNLAIEVNLFFEHCPAAAAGLIDVANAAYDAAKARDPSLSVFPSIQIDHLYGYDPASCTDAAQRDACFDRNYAQIAPLHRDRFAMSSYPIPLGGMSVATLPPDWFSRGAARAGEPMLIAETGTIATSLVVKPRDAACLTVFTNTEADVTAYLARVLADARALRMDLATWWSDRDLVVPELMTACPCTFDTTWCAVLDAFRGPATTAGPDTQLLGELSLKAFGTMGLRTYDGQKKPHYALWNAARAAP